MCGGTWGQPGAAVLSSGEGSHRGRRWLARALWRGGAPVAAARRPVCVPEQARTGYPPPRGRELATRERPAITTTRTTRPARASHRRKAKEVARR